MKTGSDICSESSQHSAWLIKLYDIILYKICDSHCVELHLNLLSKLTWKVIPHVHRELQSKGTSCDYDLPTCSQNQSVFLTSLVTLFLNVTQSPFQYQVSFLSQLSITCLCIDWYNLESVVFIFSCWRHFRSVRLHFLAEKLETSKLDFFRLGVCIQLRCVWCSIF